MSEASRFYTPDQIILVANPQYLTMHGAQLPIQPQAQLKLPLLR
jgi:hypothetical protein